MFKTVKNNPDESGDEDGIEFDFDQNQGLINDDMLESFERVLNEQKEGAEFQDMLKGVMK